MPVKSLGLKTAHFFLTNRPFWARYSIFKCTHECHGAAARDKKLPEDLKTEVEELLLLVADKERLCDYVRNATKKTLDKNNLFNASDAAVKRQREIPRAGVLVLIRKVYGVSPQIFFIRFEDVRPIASKKEPKDEHRGRDRWGDSRGEEEGAKKGKSAKGAEGAEKPNFSLSGKLAEDANVFNGVVVKYSEPPEARMPKKRWRLYPFKGDQGLPTLYIHRQSAYLLGRDRKVADIPIDHPSCSKQHAALQYRLVTYRRVDGTTGKQIRLYIIDLESANGTYINNNKIEPRKYVELFEKDVIKFGFSSREYVLLHEHSKDDDESENES